MKPPLDTTASTNTRTTETAEPAGSGDAAKLASGAAGIAGRLVDRIKSLPAAAPGAASALRDRARQSFDGVSLSKFKPVNLKIENLKLANLKFDKARLSAGVENLLKPRAVDPSDPVSGVKPVRSDTSAETSAKAPDIAPDITPGEDTPRTRWTTSFSRRKPAVESETVDVADVATSRTTQTGRVRRVAALKFSTIVTALLTGGIVHILTTFAIPAFNSNSAFDRMKFALAANTMQVFPADLAKAPPLPFLSPDMRYAMCKYDIANGTVQVSAVLPEIGWSLTLYTPQGDNFYAVPGLPDRVVETGFSIVAASDRLNVLAPGVRKTDVDATQVTSPQREGLVVIRAPNKGSAFQGDVDLVLAKATCKQVVRK